MSKIAWSLAFVSLALSACAGAGPPRLTPIGGVIPAGVSLEGRWQLRAGSDNAQERIQRAGYRNEGPSVFVFLRTGSRLKVTQTPYALFVSFDRSVVEEYRFKEHRIVNVGPIEADRASGWVAGRYVIRTLDDEGVLLEETYALEPGGDGLIRTVSIDLGNEKVLDLRQLYDRME